MDDAIDDAIDDARNDAIDDAIDDARDDAIDDAIDDARNEAINILSMDSSNDELDESDDESDEESSNEPKQHVPVAITVHHVVNISEDYENTYVHSCGKCICHQYTCIGFWVFIMVMLSFAIFAMFSLGLTWAGFTFAVVWLLCSGCPRALME